MTCAQRSGYGEAREIETLRRFRGDCNGCKNECQGMLSGVHDERYPSLTLRSPSDL